MALQEPLWGFLVNSSTGADGLALPFPACRKACTCPVTSPTAITGSVPWNAQACAVEVVKNDKHQLNEGSVW